MSPGYYSTAWRAAASRRYDSAADAAVSAEHRIYHC